MPDVTTVQSLTSSDRDEVLAVDQSAFGFDDRGLDPDRATSWIEWDRAFGVRRGDALAAIYVVFSYGLSVPARQPEITAVVPMAGLSWVSVHPDHRRQGLLSAMMGHHLHSVHEASRGEALSCLFASESAIYGRFGYGPSTQSRRLTLPAQAGLRAPRDEGDVVTRFEGARPDKHDGLVKQVYDAACRLRPGHTVRPRAQWKHFLDDPVARRPAEAEPLKIVAERHGDATGYAVLRRKPHWDEHGPDGTVNVVDLHAVDTPSAYALWRRVLDLDLMAEVKTPGLPLDHPLTIWASEVGARSEPGHTLWTRVIDVPAALATRGYARDLEVVLEVSDELCPWNAGRWQLAAGAHGSTCERTTADADLALDIRDLGSVYLGGTTWSAMATAGLVDELTPGALARASAAFRSPLMPATPYMF